MKISFEISRPKAAVIADAKAPATKPSQEYDVVTASGRGLRRNPKIERHGEHGAASRQLNPRKALEAIALARDAYRNTSGARIIEDQWLENAVGSDFKLSIQIFEKDAEGNNVKPKSVRDAETWFNKRWAKNCNLKKDQHLNDFFRCSFSSWFREGDHGLFFDADLLATGKMAAYEADEFASVSAADLKLIPGAATQANGVVFDAFGREIAYIRNKKGRGATCIPIADAHIFLRDPDNPDTNNFKLVRRDWRFNQARGVGRMIAPLADILDAGEIKTNEVSASKIQSALPVVVKPHGDDEDDDLGNMDPNASTQPNSDQDPATKDNQLVELRDDYSEAFAGMGAKAIYADSDDDVTFPQMTRPNLNTTQMLEWLQRYSGASVGLFSCYSGGIVNKAYTAFRGEMALTWVSIYNAIKWFEREVKDWVGIRALRWAMETGRIPELPEGWEDALKWSNPRMPDVSLSEEQDGVTKKQKNGASTLADEVGPVWEDILEQQGRENKAAARNGVALARNEMKSGGAAKPAKETEEKQNEEQS